MRRHLFVRPRWTCRTEKSFNAWRSHPTWTLSFVCTHIPTARLNTATRTFSPKNGGQSPQLNILTCPPANPPNLPRLEARSRKLQKVSSTSTGLHHRCRRRSGPRLSHLRPIRRPIAMHALRSPASLYGRKWGIAALRPTETRAPECYHCGR